MLQRFCAMLCPTDCSSQRGGKKTMPYRTVTAVMLLIILVSGGWAMVWAWQTRLDRTNRHSSANATLTVVAQSSPDESETSLVIDSGEENSTRLVDITGAVQNLAALHILLRSTTQRVRIDRVTIGFGDQMGDPDFVDTMQVRLIEDRNVNGRQDDADLNLGNRSIMDLEEMQTVTFNLQPPLILQQNSETALLILLDINSSGAQAASVRRFSLRPVLLMGWWLLLLPMFGLLLSRYLPHDSKRCYVLLLIVVVGWSLGLAGCNDDGDDELTFVVNLPSNGLSNRDVRLGPPQAIPGITIRLAATS
jgi:hypothetical protein